MRLVILTAQVSPYHNARYVAAAKHFDEVHVVSSMNSGEFPEFLAKSIGDYYLHRVCMGREEYSAAVSSGELSRRIWDTLSRLEPSSIAVAGWTAPESLTALRYSRERDVPIVVMSESQQDDAPRSLFRETVKRRIVSSFGAALVGGPPHAKYTEFLGIPPDRIHFGYNVVDNKYFEGQAERARSNATAWKQKLQLPERYVLASARFIQKKNLSILVEAFADARNRIGCIPELVILGDGPERSRIESAIRSRELENFVHLPGFRSYDTLPAHYALAEAFIHVSTSEQWGLVVNEAMACSVPVIVSATCGAGRTLINDGHTGLVTQADRSSISNAIVRLFSMSAQQRVQIGAAGAQVINQWGPDRFASGMLAAVKSASSANSRGRLTALERLFISHLQKREIYEVQ